MSGISPPYTFGPSILAPSQALAFSIAAVEQSSRSGNNNQPAALCSQFSHVRATVAALPPPVLTASIATLSMVSSVATRVVLGSSATADVAEVRSTRTRASISRDKSAAGLGHPHTRKANAAPCAAKVTTKHWQTPSDQTARSRYGSRQLLLGGETTLNHWLGFGNCCTRVALGRSMRTAAGPQGRVRKRAVQG